MITDEKELQRAAEELSAEKILVAARTIAPGDEHALLLDEAESIAARAVHVRRASGAARTAARTLLAKLGHPDSSIPKSASGAPLWPDGIVGSLAHDEEVAVAAAAQAAEIVALGIDVEPAVPLPSELQELVLTRREQRQPDDGFGGRLVFSAKEAVYKAVAALDGTLLDYQDIETDLAGQRATIIGGRCLALRYRTAPRLIVLAFMPHV